MPAEQPDWVDVMLLIEQQHQEGLLPNGSGVVADLLRRQRGLPESRPPVARRVDPLPVTSQPPPPAPAPAKPEPCRALLCAVEQLLQQAHQLSPDDTAITDLLQAATAAIRSK